MRGDLAGNRRHEAHLREAAVDGLRQVAVEVHRVRQRLLRDALLRALVRGDGVRLRLRRVAAAA